MFCLLFHDIPDVDIFDATQPHARSEIKTRAVGFQASCLSPEIVKYNVVGPLNGPRLGEPAACQFCARTGTGQPWHHRTRGSVRGPRPSS